jgi:hypothetical protein
VDILKKSSQELIGQFPSNLVQNGIQNFTNKEPGPLQRGNSHKMKKNEVGSFKNIFLKTHLAKRTFI